MVGGLLAIVAGVKTFIAVWWSTGPEKFACLLAWFLIGFGALWFTRGLFEIFLPGGTGSSSADKQSEFKRNAMLTTACLLFIALIVGSGYYIWYTVKTTEHNQLAEFGITKKIGIKKLAYRRSLRASFDFEFDHNLFSASLPASNYREGDSACITFSSQNPEIVRWAECP
jgi:NADH:ubiquinone oxidoreductase subunit 5 (subunit L)/multisubunit Na+/H+ antiporter MnhA subunit